MTKLEKLINELCPDGVEYVKIGDVTEMKRGTSATKKDLQSGNIPVISGGKEPAFYCNKNNRDGETVTVAGSGAGAGYVQYWDIPIFVNDAFSVKGNEKLMTKYIFYFLSSIQDKIYSTKKGGGVPHVHISSIENFPIPVPPIEIQREIVRILDKFSDVKDGLIPCLQKELELRKKQYSYYRDKLLTFGDDVEYKTLGEIGRVSMCKRIMKNQTNSESGVPFFKIGTFGKKADAYISFELFNEYKQKYPYPKKSDILISASGTIGRTVIFDGNPAYFQDSNIVWIDNDETIVSNKYLYYFYQTNPWKISEGGTIARLYNDDLAKIRIPVPPKEEQERIVKILDRFDTLCNDLTSGIPAEISARQKQYEYYRNKLLTFKEVLK